MLFCLEQIIARTARPEQTILLQFPISAVLIVVFQDVTEATMLVLFFAFMPLVSVYLNQ